MLYWLCKYLNERKSIGNEMLHGKDGRGIIGEALMPKAKHGEEQKQSVLRQMCDSTGESDPPKVIRFRNQDVPKFLKQLIRFEQRSRETRRMIG